LDSSEDFGTADIAKLGTAIPVYGDQKTALFGQPCYYADMAKSTYVTSCLLLLNNATKALKANNSLLTIVTYQPDGKARYALEGSIFTACTANQ